MTIPPFPSQDLAKLVLGYLAEEQLMTAYDEFLQASPYLDAFRNEYDRIFMTSLKNILAEYRAVKIYVETCKPFLLRKKMLQCSNLLDVVKLLINYADINKLSSQDSINDRISVSKQNISVGAKESFCEVCASLNLAGCVCQSKQNRSIVHYSHVETSSKENSVEATALEDLPGNQNTSRKKYTRVVEKDSTVESNVDVSDNTKQSATCNSSNNGLNCNQSSVTKPNENVLLNLSSIVKPADTPECREKIEEFNNILNKVCNNKSMKDTRMFSVPESESLSRRISNSTFQNFASGVSGSDSRNVPVPDSSTSENSSNGQTLNKENSMDTNNTQSDVSRDVNEHLGIQPSNTYSYPRIKPKSNDHKIKIISDIKVDSPFPTLSNATSTPLMQTIVINGTPAYKQKLPVANDNYTKDEIMAMPTIIVVPTSAPTSQMTQRQPVLSQKQKKVKTKTTSSKNVLGPLVIDVSSSPVVIDKEASSQPGVSLQSSGIETGLVRTVDSSKNSSVPKDNIISDSTQTNTPQVLPPLRKSSSTPRRNSHIRVLDFATPRRILHETIHETIPQENNAKSAEVIVTGSPNIVFPETTECRSNIIDMSSVKVHKIETCHISNTNDNKPKKSNWDADLRALAIANEKSAQTVVRKPKKNSKKKTEKNNVCQEKATDVNSESKKVRIKRKNSPKEKKSKRKKLEEEEEQYNDMVKANETNVTVKPTFNIVTADKLSTSQESTKVDETQNKSNEEVRETPEAERISLQNEIGIRLNISDLLETPYKQALYDIQMETPKFLGSVLPDEPISDIKIMNIPTPRFFDTPKPMQATPSYSSRATDYSSGGSYYKPDEQDYLRIPDLECPVTSSKEVSNTELSKEINNDSKKHSRPVRKCTKNVSYKAQTLKGKVTDDKVEIVSSCSETASINSSFEHTKENVKTPRTPKENKLKSLLKSSSKKKTDSNKKRRSPMKKDRPNTFMKIKPRRLTPTKDNKRTKRNSVVSLTNSPKSQIKKKTTGKDKTVHITPAVTSAPTKSRRKSSTPRKLHCTKQFNSESSVDSPENVINAKSITQDQAFVTSQCQDSDTEQLALRWSDDGSQDSKLKVSECEDISKIKEYIESSLQLKTSHNEGKGTLQVDLIKRGFDAETAKIIERDLLDTPDSEQSREVYVKIPEIEQDAGSAEKKPGVDTSLTTTDLQEDEEVAEEEDLELSTYECNEESNNYIVCTSESKDTPQGNPVTLKDAWCMEVCIEDGAPIRLRATSLNILFDVPPQTAETGYSFKETEIAVCSISNVDTLYTPLKDRRSQCYEIFDSTLTSLDTPLKLSSPKAIIHKTTEIEIVVEEEKMETKDNKKRKRLQRSSSPEDSLNETKKAKPEAQYLFNSTNIQNIDIESVLKKLHGP
ncbi:unnamed protein product [Arctia plantaginis]|uniref:Uncharacterized protein n=1 Tax=Arctia plantaginis TaxID=874455 RepID=A0A8S0ZXQ8_ARCPL|nr:unnamed protein product [Arctia plantaginis]